MGGRSFYNKMKKTFRNKHKKAKRKPNNTYKNKQFKKLNCSPAVEGETPVKDSCIPDDILINHLSKEEIQDYKKGNTTISSVTVYAEKPLKDSKVECTPGGGCC
jgi:hypothetical protein